jgi:large subunit ribosomal protein L17
MPATPRKGKRFGGSASHQRLMFANMAASLFAAEGIVTTEAKAKALRPIAEKLITKARKGGVHNHRQVVSYMGDKDMAHKLFEEIAPRYAEREGGYTRILKLGPRRSDSTEMVFIELV